MNQTVLIPVDYFIALRIFSNLCNESDTDLYQELVFIYSSSEFRLLTSGC
jgi:hypothetical protein